MNDAPLPAGYASETTERKTPVPPPVLEVFPLPSIIRRTESDNGRRGVGKVEEGRRNAMTATKEWREEARRKLKKKKRVTVTTHTT